MERLHFQQQKAPEVPSGCSHGEEALQPLDGEGSRRTPSEPSHGDHTERAAVLTELIPLSFTSRLVSDSYRAGGQR